MKLWLYWGFKRLRSEVESYDSLYIQVIGVEIKIRVPQVPWISTNINFMESMYQFVCLHPNVLLGGLWYLKSRYIIYLSLGISRSYSIFCKSVMGFYYSSWLWGMAKHEGFINLTYVTHVISRPEIGVYF